MTTDPSTPVVDVTFIGAGPSGLFGAFYAGLRELSARIIDVLPLAGGQLTALYPDKTIYDVPGHPAILAKDLVTNLLRQAEKWKPAILLGERGNDAHPRPSSRRRPGRNLLAHRDRQRHLPHPGCHPDGRHRRLRAGPPAQREHPALRGQRAWATWPATSRPTPASGC